MLTGYTKSELDELLRKLKEKTDKGVDELYEAAANQRITDYDEMLNELKDLANQWEYEYHDYTDDYSSDDSNSSAHCAIEDIEDARRDGKCLCCHARLMVELSPVLDAAVDGGWRNADGMPCDEYGRTLTLDRKHHVFEVIKGGRYKERRR